MNLYLARLIVLCGLVAVCSGVWVLAGYGWGLVALGIGATFIGLVLVDVDDRKGDKAK